MLYIYTHIYLDFLAFNEFWANFHKFWTFFHKDVTGWSLVTFFNTTRKTPHVFSLLDPENSEKKRRVEILLPQDQRIGKKKVEITFENEHDFNIM